MKWFSKMLMVAMLVLGGCANEGTTDAAVDAGEKVRISVGLPESRLQLGEKEGESSANVLRTRWSRKSSGMSATKLASEFWKPNPPNSQRMYGFVRKLVG